MIPTKMLSMLRIMAGVLALGVAPPSSRAADLGPKPGELARDFELKALGGETVKLSRLTEKGPVVLVVLRGYPGYQCPLCTRQFGEFIGKAEAFAAAGAQVVFVYPGPAERLTQKAGDFVKGKDYPAHFTVLLDPDYAFTTGYGLRWKARNETAYPSTFVIGKDGKVVFAKVSTTHAGRVAAADALANVPKK